MRNRLRLYAVLVLVVMLLVSVWASRQVSILAIPSALLGHPWFVATLFDAYFAFLWFWLWLAWRERSWTARLLWLGAILALGNMAMALYVLLALRRLPPDAAPDALLRRA